MNLEDELTEEKIKTMKCFGKLLDMVFAIRNNEKYNDNEEVENSIIKQLKESLNEIKISDDILTFINKSNELAKNLDKFYKEHIVNNVILYMATTEFYEIMKKKLVELDINSTNYIKDFYNIFNSTHKLQQQIIHDLTK